MGEFATSRRTPKILDSALVFAIVLNQEAQKKTVGAVVGRSWQEFDTDLSVTRKLQQAMNLHPLTALFLCNRGIKDVDGAHSFLYPCLHDLPSPFLLKDMDKAANRLAEAVRRRERILIYGDYDADGITSTAVLWLFLRKIGACVSFYIPDRLRDGYGLKTEVLKRLFVDRPDLLVTVDCGISNHAAVTFANEQGVDVIITDHHLAPAAVPEALAVVNPKQNGCLFPDKDLAGVGVAFNLALALRRILFQESDRPNLKEFLDLVALGTIADMVTLRGENRILVAEGLKVLSDGVRPGIAALKAVSLLKGAKISSHDVGFRLAPRLNAAGRMGSAEEALGLLITEDPAEAERIAVQLNEANGRRQAVEEVIFSEVVGRINEEVLETDKALVYASSSWHKGVLGIVASRLAARFGRPAILFAVEKGMAKGSGRSGADIDLYEMVEMCQAVVEEFGGHREAAGLSVREENLAEFRRLFLSHVAERIRTEDLVPKLWLEGSVQLSTLRQKAFLDDFRRMPPFGNGNPSPTLGTSPVRIVEQRLVADKHTRLRVQQDGQTWEAIGFNMIPSPELELQEASLAFALETSSYQGRDGLQLRVVDLKVGDWTS